MRRVGRRVDDPKILIYAVPVTEILDDYIARREFPQLRRRYIEAGLLAERGQKAPAARRWSAA